MRSIKLVVFCLLFAFPVVALGFESDDLPSTSTWYFHADFEEMRSSEGGMGRPMLMGTWAISSRLLKEVTTM